MAAVWASGWTLLNLAIVQVFDMYASELFEA
jgi:hypothetical protein